jgi:hypothetical protein
MYGNNIQSTKIRRVTVPLFNDAGTEDGQRYFLPQLPEIDNKYIVGIEADVRGGGGSLNDNTLRANGSTAALPTNTLSKYIFVYFKDSNKFEKNGYIPLRSLVRLTGNNKKKVMPYYGSISTRDSFLTIPANSIGIKTFPLYVTLTFYYIQ